MNYTVTCVCGQQFIASDAHLNKHVTCPACNRALIPVLAEPLETPTPAGATAPQVPLENTKRCPFCGESILAIAKKCRYCGEFLDRNAAPSDGAKSAATQTPDDTPPVFALSVSQWDNAFKYVICITTLAALLAAIDYTPDKYLAQENKVLAMLIALMVVGVIMYFLYASTRAARCRIWPLRLETETGIFSKRTESLDLFRVLHVDLRQNMLQRILGFGTVVITTADKDQPTVELYQIPQARKVFKYLQAQVPIAAKERGVTYIER